MKQWKNPGLAVLGMAILALLLSTCQKEDELMLMEEQQLELREKKCTKTDTKTTIEVNVPKDATAAQIENAVRPALQNAIDKEKDPVVKAVLQSMLPMLPGESVAMSWYLSETDVQALTRPFYLYATVGDRLHIIVVNIILIEDGADARAKEHEKGHEYIANEVAKKCAEKASKESGADCADAANAAATVSKLQELNKQASDAYDLATQSGQSGDQMKEAREAAKTVIEGYLGK